MVIAQYLQSTAQSWRRLHAPHALLPIFGNCGRARDALADADSHHRLSDRDIDPLGQWIHRSGEPLHKRQDLEVRPGKAATQRPK
jgi:hypothetical protein